MLLAGMEQRSENQSHRSCNDRLINYRRLVVVGLKFLWMRSINESFSCPPFFCISAFLSIPSLLITSRLRIDINRVNVLTGALSPSQVSKCFIPSLSYFA